MIWNRVKPAEGSLRDLCCSLTCGDCARHYAHCTRIDHKATMFWTPWFKCDRQGGFLPYVCRDFVPKPCRVWLHDHWKGWEDYWGRDVLDFVRSDRVFIAFTARHGDERFVALKLEGSGWTWDVHIWDWWEGAFRNRDGSLRWIKRWRPKARGWGYINEYNEKEIGL